MVAATPPTKTVRTIFFTRDVFVTRAPIYPIPIKAIPARTNETTTSVPKNSGTSTEIKKGITGNNPTETNDINVAKPFRNGLRVLSVPLPSFVLKLTQDSLMNPLKIHLPIHSPYPG
jgi:hypothetical protein